MTEIRHMTCLTLTLSSEQPGCHPAAQCTATTARCRPGVWQTRPCQLRGTSDRGLTLTSEVLQRLDASARQLPRSLTPATPRRHSRWQRFQFTPISLQQWQVWLHSYIGGWCSCQQAAEMSDRCMTRWQTGSQCSCRNTGVMSSQQWAAVTRQYGGDISACSDHVTLWQGLYEEQVYYNLVVNRTNSTRDRGESQWAIVCPSNKIQ